VLLHLSGPDPLVTEIVQICRCPAGAFLAANLRARAAAGGCSSCSSNLFVPGRMLTLSMALAVSLILLRYGIWLLLRHPEPRPASPFQKP